MKLSKEQIAIIDETLILNGVFYDDIKLELTDHIASEIESDMELTSNNFEQSLKFVFEKWKEDLVPSSSFWIGNETITAKIVINKWEAIHKTHIRFSIVFAIIGTILALGLRHIFTNANVYLFPFIKYSSLLFFVVTLFVLIKNYKNLDNTLFGFIFKKRTKLILIFNLLIGLGVYPINKNFYTISILLLYFSVSITSLILAFNHFSIENKINKA